MTVNDQPILSQPTGSSSTAGKDASTTPIAMGFTCSESDSRPNQPSAIPMPYHWFMTCMQKKLRTARVNAALVLLWRLKHLSHMQWWPRANPDERAAFPDGGLPAVPPPQPISSPAHGKQAYHLWPSIPTTYDFGKQIHLCYMPFSFNSDHSIMKNPGTFKSSFRWFSS